MKHVTGKSINIIFTKNSPGNFIFLYKDFIMKRLLPLVLLCLTGLLNSQITSNTSFEMWTNTGNYEEPSGGWTTLNKLRDLGSLNPVTVSKTTDSYSGTYAARLETKEITGFGTLIGGLLAAGIFDNNASPGQNVKLGQPYTERPLNFDVYYKYTSVNSDSAAFYLALTKWNSSTSSRDTIGEAFYTEYNTVSAYTQLNIPINYYQILFLFYLAQVLLLVIFKDK